MRQDKQRLYYIDWLRLLAVLLLFFFHTARIFDPWEDFYVHGQVSHKLYNVFIWAIGPWHMSLFFLLAGASTWFALKHRSSVQYSRERLLRLFLPFLIWGLLLVPPQSYLGLLSHSGSGGSYLGWYPHFFTLHTADEDGYFMGGYTWGHLWFIIHLFIYSLLLLPLLQWLRRERGRGFITRLAATRRHWAIFLAAPLSLLILDIFPEILGGRPLYYMGLFVCGYIIVADPRFMDAVDRRRLTMLALGPLALVAIIILTATTTLRAGLPDPLNGMIDDYQDIFATWFTILALLAYGRRLLDFSNRLLSYFAESAYPFYILHQTIIVIIGYYALKWDLALPLKYSLVVLLSFAACLLIYDLAVRRTRLTRFLFGMKPARR